MQIEAGAVLEGRVTGIKPFGAFVRLENGVTGLVHISEVSVGFVENVSDVLAVDQTVRVKVLSVSPEGKVALSIRKALPRPEGQSRSGAAGKASRRDAPRVWQPPRRRDEAEPLSFEDMMARYRQCSEERLGELNRCAEHRRGKRRK